jgi:gas vesicle structural protein
MTTATTQQPGSTVGREKSAQGLADVVGTILDKGLVIEAYIEAYVLGIELLTIEARVTVASVDTYIQFAEACQRLDLPPTREHKGLSGLLEGPSSQGSGDDGAPAAGQGLLGTVGGALQGVLPGNSGSGTQNPVGGVLEGVLPGGSGSGTQNPVGEALEGVLPGGSERSGQQPAGEAPQGGQPDERSEPDQGGGVLGTAGEKLREFADLAEREPAQPEGQEPIRPVAGHQREGEAR